MTGLMLGLRMPTPFPPGHLPLATLSADFIAGTASRSGVPVALASAVACQRASTGCYTSLAGVVSTVAANLLRRGDRGLLVEGARTNLVSRSSDLAAWTPAGATIALDNIASPDGTTGGDTISSNGASADNNLGRQFSDLAGTAFTYSMYVGRKTGTPGYTHRITLRYSGAAEVVYLALSLDPVSGAASVLSVALPDAIAVEAVGNWWRLTVTRTYPVTAGSLTVRLYPAYDTIAATMPVWQAQLEAAAGATSPIPTLADPATRAADVVTAAVTSGSYDVLVRDGAGGEWRNGVAVSGGSYTVTPRSGQRFITRLALYPAGLVSAEDKAALLAA
ncbi:MAG: hypothetical protein R3D02_12100 [Hyphomicrobiales bacterium]